ncbi:hypothetical protein DRO03_08905 [Methanosarcinales archaeon]|nr:MAG: hypothetical protein DRO03_08905 [Methanosarcinales archaeon]
MSCVDLEVASPIMVDAQIHRWTITNDNIYLLKFNEAPPQWLEDMFQNIIDDTGLADDLDNLEDRFDNFEEGYTEHFYDWQDGDVNTLAYVENIYTSNANFNAGLQEIKVAYVSHAESGAMWDSLIGAWQTGAGGAWFNEQVSVVSNVAYSAAKSASTLTATMKSQQSQLEAIVGDIETLEKQIDGKVVTWKGFHAVARADGTLIEDAKPYACWLPGVICTEPEFNDSSDLDTRAEHTGDTYLLVELDSYGKEKLLGVYRFGKDTATDNYNWFILEDDLAAVAYQQALDAGVLADGKINSYYQPTPPTIIEDPTMGAGDIWLDSSDNNKMYRYSGTDWIAVRDTDITASVNRLDQATVDVDGVATARSSLTVDADGYTSGIRLSATNDPLDPGSEFIIFADKFSVAASDKQDYGSRPFTIDTNTRDIRFNGKVTFSNIEDASGNEPNWLFAGQAANDINTNTTTINGGKIQTYSLNANRIAVDTLWARGIIASEEQRHNNTGYIPNSDPAGFLVSGKAGSGSFNYPNVYGAYIRGGYIYGSTIEASTMKVRDLVVLTDAGLPTKAVWLLKPATGFNSSGSLDFSSYSDTSHSKKCASKSGTIIQFFGDDTVVVPASDPTGSSISHRYSGYNVLGTWDGTNDNKYTVEIRVMRGSTVIYSGPANRKVIGMEFATSSISYQNITVLLMAKLCEIADFSGQGVVKLHMRSKYGNNAWSSWSPNTRLADGKLDNL